MEPNTPVRTNRVSHWLDSYSILSLASPLPSPVCPLILLFGACQLLLSSKLWGKSCGFGVIRISFPALTRLDVKPWARPFPALVLSFPQEKTELEDTNILPFIC